MTYIVKKSNVECKGIILISHREILFYSLAARILGRTFSSLKKNYFIVLHVGAYYRSFDIPLWVDYLFTTPGNIAGSNLKDNEKFIDICSRDVLPEYFTYRKKTTRDIDCIYIANNSKNKRVKEYLELIKRSPELKFILVLSNGLGTDSNKFDLDIVDDIYEYQNVKGDSTNLEFIDAKHKKDGSYAVSREEISNLLNRSKVYIHFCRREGESRAIGEALSTGCYVFTHNELVGGANDICVAENSDKFMSLNSLKAKLSILFEVGVEHNDIAENYDMIRQRVFDSLTLCLKSMGMNSIEINDLFIKNDLSMVLPGHVKPSFKSNGVNSDIENINDFENLCAALGLNNYIFPTFILWKVIGFLKFIKVMVFSLRYKFKV